MTVTNHELVPIHHVETDYPIEAQDDLNIAAKALVAVLGRIRGLTGARFKELSDTGAIPVVELHTIAEPEEIEVATGISFEASSEDVARIQQLAESVQQLIAKAGETGMTNAEFQVAAATAEAKIDFSSDATMQALLFGLEERMFWIRDDDGHIVATPVSTELQDA